MTAPTLLVMAGGTGGHIMPGIAVAETLKAKGWRIAWMGNAEGMEARLIAGREYEPAWISFGALRGKGLLRKLLLPLNLLRGFAQAWRQLSAIRPDVVLGLGGYVSFPGGMMAALRGIPFVVHEQNSIAGLANRVLAGVADRVLCGFPNALNKGQWVGNPVRQDLAVLPAPTFRFASRQGPLRLLVVGGSLGARALNDTMPEAMARLPIDQRPEIMHQTGAQQLAEVERRYAAAGISARTMAFITDMAQAYAWADLVVCRSGALTVAELAAVGLPSVLVPFPHAVDDHQTANARFLTNAGAAMLLPQDQLTPERLTELGRLSRAQLLEMAQKARALARPDAAEAVAAVCAELRKNRS